MKKTVLLLLCLERRIDLDHTRAPLVVLLEEPAMTIATVIPISDVVVIFGTDQDGVSQYVDT